MPVESQISPSVALVKSMMQFLLTARNFAWKGSSRKKAVAITFDDGPHPDFTLPCLETLQSFDMKATFFLIGQNVREYPEIVREIHRQGHELGIHTYSHPFTLHQMSFENVREELFATRDLIQQITGDEVRIYRPPRGQLSVRLLLFTSMLRFATILWNVTLLDHQKISTEYLVQQIEQITPVPGDIILLHDNNPFTVEALPALLQRIGEAGLSGTTISGLLGFLHETSKAA